MIPGVEIDMGGRTWTVPPLTIGQLIPLAPRLKMLEAVGAPIAMTQEQIEALLDVVLGAMGRNYPDLTRTELAGLLDTGNTLPVVFAIMYGSGFKQGEALPAEKISQPVSAGS